MSIEDGLRRLSNEWMQAWQNKDRETLDALLAPEFRLTSARTDQWVTRDEWIELAMGPVTNTSYSFDAMEIAVFDGAAIVWSRFSQVASVGEEDWSQQFMLTDVWVGREGTWQVAARHASQPPTKAFV